VHAVPPGERPDQVPERPATMVAENSGWPRVTPQKAETTGAIRTRRHTRSTSVRTARLATALEKKKSKTQTASAIDFSALWSAR
jgi:hypothetical protein